MQTTLVQTNVFVFGKDTRAKSCLCHVTVVCPRPFECVIFFRWCGSEECKAVAYVSEDGMMRLPFLCDMDLCHILFQHVLHALPLRLWQIQQIGEAFFKDSSIILLVLIINCDIPPHVPRLFFSCVGGKDIVSYIVYLTCAKLSHMQSHKAYLQFVLGWTGQDWTV